MERDRTLGSSTSGSESEEEFDFEGDDQDGKVPRQATAMDMAPGPPAIDYFGSSVLTVQSQRSLSRQYSRDAKRKRKMNFKAGCRSPGIGERQVLDVLRLTLDLNQQNVNINVQPVYKIRDESTVASASPAKRTKYLPASTSRSEQVIEILSSSDESAEGNQTNKIEQSRDSDVICLDSDSENSDIRSLIQKPLPVHTLSDYQHNLEYDSDASSSVSDLPEIPLLEPMTSSSEVIASEPCTLKPKAKPEEYFEPEERHWWPEIGEHSQQETIAIKEEDREASRHSSGEPEEYLDNPKDACWTALLSFPEHVKAADQSVRKQRHNHSFSRVFSQDKHNVVYSCQDEDFTHSAVALIDQFSTTAHKPSAKCLQALFHETLRVECTSYSDLCKVYSCLKNIQHLHHPSSRDFPIEWKHIKSLVESMHQVRGHSPETSLQWHTNLFALRFLVTVLEDDLERKTKWNTLKKSYVFALLNPETCRPQCSEVREWLHRLVTEFAGPASTCGCPEGMCLRNELLLVEKLLQLSIRLTTQWNYREYLQNVAEELNSLGLADFHQVQVMFETLQHDELRLRLSELLFNSYYECEVMWDNSNRRETISMSRIVDGYFFYLTRQSETLPSKCAMGEPSSSFAGEEEMQGRVEEGVDGRTAMSLEQRVELMVYLLLIMVQSYLKCSDGSSSSRTDANKKSSIWSTSFLPARRLTDEDQICLIQMGDFVDRLRGHVTALCGGGHMTLRTRMWLDQMSTLYDWFDR